MMKYLKMFLLQWLFLAIIFSLVKSEWTVDEYLTHINDFINKTKTYQFPNDSRTFVNGTYKEIGCEYGGIFDFIIVGAGSTGSVLANRLSEINKFKILLLEAGGMENEITDIPFLFEFLRMSDFNWGYKSVPQKNSLKGLLNNQAFFPRGKVCGGTSVLNAMIYSRGNKNDHDKWAALGNPGWSYDELLPYFKKSEKANLVSKDEDYHGYNGTLNVENVNILTPITQSIFDAYAESGFTNLDYNGKDQMGYSLLQVTEINGRRNSGCKAFIKPAKYRKNLTIRFNAFVTKLLLLFRSAFGVKYMQNGRTFCAFSKKEVIVSAGSFNSPQLLMLSGIGPANHLRELGIPVIKNLSVGLNLWDHICMPLQPFTTNILLKNQTQREIVEEYLNGKGVYTVADAVQNVLFQTFYSSDKTNPDIEFILRAGKVVLQQYEFYKKLKNFGEDMYNYILKPLEGNVTYNLYSLLVHPKSRGTVKLRSKSPFDHPLIDPQYFTDPDDTDLKTIIASMREMIKISNTDSMKKIDSQISRIDLPNCRDLPYLSDAYLGCLIKNLANTINHFSGTCKMGPPTDKSAVVGYDSKVHGIKHLRVADTSIIPIPISGHTNAEAYMIGERISDLIKKEYL